jgi:fluoride exporter
VGRIFLVGMGGFIGSVLRYVLGGVVQQWSRSETFPYGTLGVNLIGCLVIGFLAELAETHGMFSAESRAFVFIGILGGFTTFSAFGNETMNLWRDGENIFAFANVAAQVVFGLGAVWLGRTLAYQIWG